ncbi:MAG: PilZ domain-containing protein [Proteobacteria bacterium]|nr:PilZ domain-containing protein [Pseudomonadota bacterium]
MEQRTEARIASDIRFFVNIHESSHEPDMVGMSLECEAVDVSAHGMQFSTHSELSAGSQLNITIGIGEPFAMYLLRGQIQWVRPRDDIYYMGILLSDAAETDLKRWVDNFDTQFSS